MELTVEDSGPGLDDEAVERVFEPFVRLEESRHRETGGIGLGMAIAKSVVEAHGGTIQMESEVGEGTTCRIGLPVKPPARAGE